MSINQSSGTNRSYWLKATRSLTYEPLTKNIKVDVAVLGAGMAGLNVAFALLKLGRSVLVIEDGLIASGETGRTSAHLSNYVDGRLFKLKKLFGIDALQQIIGSHTEAINRLEQIIDSEEISCEFKRVNGFLFGNHTPRILDEEMKVLDELKSMAWEQIEKAPFTHFDTGPCLKFPHQAQFHPIKYLEALASSIIKQGGQIFENTHAAHIEDGTPCKVTTKNGVEITAKDVFVATNSPINNRLLVQTKLAQYRTYILGIAVPKGGLEEGLYWDTDDPYHYLRQVHSPKSDKDYLLIGGQDHKTGQNKTPNMAFENLDKWASLRFPRREIIYKWSGQISEPIDSVAFIGKNPKEEHVYIHTGTSGSGLTYGLIASILIPDLIVGKKSPYASIYDPSRKSIKAFGRFLKESVNMTTQYLEWLKPQTFHTDKIEHHEGKIIRRGACLEAVYKDVDGNLHRMSAVCPHLFGIVQWNQTEKTWDCPCHGSRFTSHGDVINGPANKGLKKL